MNNDHSRNADSGKNVSRFRAALAWKACGADRTQRSKHRLLRADTQSSSRSFGVIRRGMFHSNSSPILEHSCSDRPAQKFVLVDVASGGKTRVATLSLLTRSFISPREFIVLSH